MARRKVQGTGLVILLGIAVIAALFLTGNLPGSIFNPQSVQFDTASNSPYTVNWNCDPSWFNGGIASLQGNTAPSGYPCSDSLNIYNNGQELGSGQSYTTVIAALGSDTNDNAFLGISGLGGQCVSSGGVTPTLACAHASAYLKQVQLQGSVSQYPFKLLGTDPSFTSTFKEPAPSCNPCNVQTVTQSANETLTVTRAVYRFEFTVRLSILNDKPVIVTQCSQRGLFASISPANTCPQAEAQALNIAIQNFNSYDKATGKVILDIGIPQQYCIVTPDTVCGILGAWTANTGCLIGTIAAGTSPQYFSGNNVVGGTANVSPCGGHLTMPLGPNPCQGTGQAAWQDLSQYTASQLQGIIDSSLNPNSQACITINSLGPTYSASCGSGIGSTFSGTTCATATSGDCVANGTCGVSYSPGLSVDIPIIVDVLVKSSNLQIVQQNITNINTNQTGCPITGCYVAPVGTVNVKVVDAITTLPLAGMAVNLYPSLGGCSGTGAGSQTTPPGGMVSWTAPPGQYVACAVGGLGSVTLFLFTVQIVYSPAQSTVTINAGQTSTVVLPLWPNLIASLTSTSFVLIAVAVVVLVVLIIVAPASLVTLGAGGAKALTSYRSRRRRR